jgi:hypothetical protein
MEHGFGVHGMQGLGARACIFSKTACHCMIYALWSKARAQEGQACTFLEASRQRTTGSIDYFCTTLAKVRQS